jgi:hypothetical protein
VDLVALGQLSASERAAWNPNICPRECPMKQTLDIVEAILDELARLEGVLTHDTPPGGALCGESQIKRMRALISDLKREIKLNAPRP